MGPKDFIIVKIHRSRLNLQWMSLVVPSRDGSGDSGLKNTGNDFLDQVSKAVTFHVNAWDATEAADKHALGGFAQWIAPFIAAAILAAVNADPREMPYDPLGGATLAIDALCKGK